LPAGVHDHGREIARPVECALVASSSQGGERIRANPDIPMQREDIFDGIAHDRVAGLAEPAAEHVAGARPDGAPGTRTRAGSRAGRPG
jgi:hypothetical protein